MLADLFVEFLTERRVVPNHRAHVVLGDLEVASGFANVLTFGLPGAQEIYYR